MMRMSDRKKNSKQAIVAALVEVCHRLYEKGFVASTDGNVSARLPNGKILTTRSGINKGMVSRGDLVEVTLDGAVLKGKKKPSTELGMHLFIYRQRPDVHAVVHAHPVYATGFAAARIPLDQKVLPEVIVGLGTVPLAQYATPSTQEVADSLAPFVKSSNAILLANHGVVTYGLDLPDAWFRMEKVEHAAHITFVAKMLGGAKTLTPDEMDRLKSISLSSYGKEVLG